MDGDLLSELLTVDEIASYLKVCRRTAWRWCKSGKLPAFKVGGIWRFRKDQFEKWVNQRTDTRRFSAKSKRKSS